MSDVYTVCGMCTVRCPAKAEVKDGKVVRVVGSPHAPGIKGSLCGRGAAGVALLNDAERPQKPLIRVGERGEGKWREASWDEALDLVAEKIKAAQDQYGKKTLLWSDRGGPFVDLFQSFMRGMGSPNYCNHDSSCARNVQHAALSLFGFGRKDVVYDLKNAKHVVLQTRNMLEAINVKEVNDLLDSLGAGGKLTVIDVRATMSSAKADNFFLIRPGTDYAFNLAVVNALIEGGLYDKAFVERWVKDFDALADFVKPHTPEWAAAECGVSAESIRELAKQLAEAAPAVIWHPGWMVARYNDSFDVCRSAYYINILLGSIGAKGGLPLITTPKDHGKKGLKKLVDLYEKPKEPRADGAGGLHPHIDAGPGLVNVAFEAVETGNPYPVKAYICWRHDPLMALPDPERQKRMLSHLDFMVAVTFSWSDSAWFSDVVLPLSTYLERESIIGQKNGLKPQLFVRARAQEPVYDSKADWEIIAGLAKRLGLPELAFEKVEDLWNFQLEGTGVTVDQFAAKGFVELGEKPLYRSVEELAFKTPSGKIEILSERLKKGGRDSLRPYKSPASPPDGKFRLTFGRMGLHTQGHTANNAVLGALFPENILWIHSAKAAELGVASGDYCEVSAGGDVERIKAFVTDFIHPEAVFMVHGFGHKLPPESRAFGKGAADQALMVGGMDLYCKTGGGMKLQEHFVAVKRAS